MNPHPDNASVNGTIEQVAAFFCKSVRTVAQWQADGDIGHWKFGRNVMFSEQDVVDFFVKHHRAARGLAPGQAEALARRAWREHLALPGMAELRQMVVEAVKSEMFIRDIQTKQAA